MRELIRSIIISFIILIVMSLCLKSYLTPQTEELKKEKIIQADQGTVLELISTLNKNEILRKPKLNNTDIDSLDIIKFILDNLKEEDYQLKLVKPLKISCNIDNIEFTQESDCTIRVISNQTILKYENSFFNISEPLEFKDFQYKGETCRNNGYNYYCLEGNYENTTENYSFIKDSFIKDNKLYIDEYYLNVDESKRVSCLKYYGRTYCENKIEKPYLKDETIIKYGVLYRLVFSLNSNGNYYLEQLYILDV